MSICVFGNCILVKINRYLIDLWVVLLEDFFRNDLLIVLKYDNFYFV